MENHTVCTQLHCSTTAYKQMKRNNAEWDRAERSGAINLHRHVHVFIILRKKINVTWPTVEKLDANIVRVKDG